MATQPLKVLFPIHPDLDTLDFCGPLELLSYAFFPSSSQKVFIPTITADHEITTTNQSLKIQRHIDIETAHSTLAEYDILIIPGGASGSVFARGIEPMNIIKAFFSLPPKSSKDGPLKGERILMSVCTGSLFLAEAGVLDGLSGTTHPAHYDDMRKIVKNKGGKGTKVLEERFVVNRKDEERNLRVVTCGGVSCGMDGSLWLIEYVVGEEEKRKVMDMVQYQGREGEGVIV